MKRIRELFHESRNSLEIFRDTHSFRYFNYYLEPFNKLYTEFFEIRGLS